MSIDNGFPNKTSIYSRYEISFGEGYWTGGLYLGHATLGLVTADRARGSRAVASLGLVTGGLVTLASVVMVILTSLNIVYTPFDISYFYHGVRRRASKLRDVFTITDKTLNTITNPLKTRLRRTCLSC